MERSMRYSYGETISYKQLAENINQPTAFRAVANANGKNQLSIIVEVSWSNSS